MIFLGGDFKNLLLTTVKLNSTLEQFDNHVHDFEDFGFPNLLMDFIFFEVQYEDKYELIYARHSDFNKSKGFWTPTCLIRQKY